MTVTFNKVWHDEDGIHVEELSAEEVFCGSATQQEWVRLESAFFNALDFIKRQARVDYDGDFPQPNAAFDLCTTLNEAMSSLYAFKPRCGDCPARYANGGCGDCNEGQG